MDLHLKTNFINSNGSDDNEPVSPLGQTLSTSLLSVCVQGIFELEQPINVSSSTKAIQDILLPSNPRFCCMMTEDENGMLRWKKTEVNVDDHIFVPEFPPGQHEYDEFVNEYICNIHLTPLSKCRPLWEFHFLNCNTSKARATLIINMHHSLGDGISLMSLMFCCVTRADNPNLSPTFPSARPVPRKRTTSPYSSWAFAEYIYDILRRLFVLVLVLWYTVSDFTISLLRMICMDDSKLPIRGPPGVEMLPKVIASVSFTLEDIKKIKNSVGGTVNDVLMGVIFYGFQRYLQIDLSHEESEVVFNDQKFANLRVTGLVCMNTRAMSGLKNIEDMMKPNSEAQWGNRFGILHIPLPLENMKSPLDFVRRAKQIIDRKKMSLEVFVTSRLLSFLGGFLGRQASAACLHKTLVNTTLAISTLVGPMEKIAMNQTPVRNFFFSISGLPQTLILTIVSYMGSVRIAVIGAKGYVDSDTLAKCFAQCFVEIRDSIK